MVNNIKNNIISETSAKKGLNTLNKMKNPEIIKHKRRTLKEKELLNLFNHLLDIFLTNKTLKSKSQKDDDNENDNMLMPSKGDDQNENENDKTLMSSNNDDETMDQNKKILK